MECVLHSDSVHGILQALRKVPDVNASWHGDFIRRYNNVDVSIAAQTSAGLMVPVLRGADGLGLREISSGIKTLATKVRLCFCHAVS